MFDYIKNTVHKVNMGVTKMIVAPPKETQFLEKGLLTPDEFVQSGDKVISMCGSWKWYSAVEPQYQSQYLPADKQFLGIEGIRSKCRIKDLMGQTKISINEAEDGDDVIISSNYVEQIQQDSTSDFQIKQSQQHEDIRTYNLYIIYDHFYFTPRLYLSGKDENGNPLTYEKIKEDIMGDYADKTVTNEYHPHLNIYLPTVHPCKHADTLKFLTQQMVDNGVKQTSIHVDNSILIFLKFMGSVIPTIEFDFVSDLILE